VGKVHAMCMIPVNLAAVLAFPRLLVAGADAQGGAVLRCGRPRAFARALNFWPAAGMWRAGMHRVLYPVFAAFPLPLLPPRCDLFHPTSHWQGSRYVYGSTKPGGCPPFP